MFLVLSIVNSGTMNIEVHVFFFFYIVFFVVQKLLILIRYSEYTTQSNLWIQCNPYQATNGIFHRARTNNFTICMEIQKMSNSQSNLEKEEWNWRNQPA